MENERVLLGHRRLIAVETVDQDRLDGRIVGGPSHVVGELARRELRGVELRDRELARRLHRGEVEAERSGSVEQQADFLVEDEHRGLVTLADGLGHELPGQRRLARPGWPDQQSARPLLDAAPQKAVERQNAGPDPRTLEIPTIFGRDQSREHPCAIRPDDEIMVAAAESLRPILDDSKATPLGAITRRQLLEPDDAMRDTVNRLVVHVGRQVVEHQHSRAVPGEIVLERKDLPPVPQRALGQQADLRQRIEHHALSPAALDGLEDQLHRLAEFQIG